LVDYTSNGDNWVKESGECKTGVQSPIDLPTSAKKTDYNSKDKFLKFYPNLKNTKIEWVKDKSTNYVNVGTNAGGVSKSEATPSAYFESKFGKDVFNAPIRFEA